MKLVINFATILTVLIFDTSYSKTFFNKEKPFAIKIKDQKQVHVRDARILHGLNLEISNPAGKVKTVKKVLRKRRQTSEQQEYLDAHNTARSIVSPTAANMKKLKWSNELAQVAQNYAQKCIWAHNSKRTEDTKALTSKFSYVGENLFATSSKSVNPSSAVESWDHEKTVYNYDTMECSGVCGHYTQVAWAHTEYVGCASATCETFNGLPSSFNGGNIVVCNYGEGGKYNGQKPYVSGTPCSSCPSGSTCSDNLCVGGDGSDTGSSGSTATNSTAMIPDESCFQADGSNYHGTVSVTVSGKQCLMWSKFYDFLPGNNYCRNYFAPYGINEPVCYIQENAHYVESCGVSKCGTV